MVRAPYYDEHGTKKGAWSGEEDLILKTYIETHGPPANWRQLPKSAGLARCGKSCRLRWMNHLRPNIKHGNFTQEEDETIINLHQHLGNKWSLIAEKLPGRSDNEIKNHWHSHIKKRLEHNATKSQFKVKPGSASKGEMIQHIAESINPGDVFYINILESSLPIPTESSHRPCPNSNQEESTMNWSNYSREESLAPCQPFESLFSSNFWSEPFEVENNNDNQAYYDPISFYGGEVETYFSCPYYYTDSCTM